MLLEVRQVRVLKVFGIYNFLREKRRFIYFSNLSSFTRYTKATLFQQPLETLFKLPFTTAPAKSHLNFVFEGFDFSSRIFNNLFILYISIHINNETKG